MKIKNTLSLLIIFSLLLAMPFMASASADDFPAPSLLERQILPPDLLTMRDGTAVTNAAQWAERQKEIRAILEYYIYGPWRDGAGEALSYAISGETLNISVTYDGKTVDFDAKVSLPEGNAPVGGFPVIVIFGGTAPSNVEYALSQGYAVITFNPNVIASDNAARLGIFYELYPYCGWNWEEQSGVLMGWSWGASKVLDALEQGAGAQLNISTEKTIITGVSRYGKAAAVAGAFDTRFAVTMPSCSGFGGLTMGRYKSNNLTYNLLPDFEKDPQASSVSNLAEWTSTGGTEGIQGLQGSGWFNETYKRFDAYNHCPFDQHFLTALTAMEGRYMFMITGINSDMWNSPPGMWYNYEESRPAFELLGLEDNLAIQMHLSGHSIELEDLVKLFAYLDWHWNGIEFNVSDFPVHLQEFLADFTLESLKTTVFASEANAEVYAEGKPQADAEPAGANPDNTVNIEIRLGDVPIATTVSRNANGDALIEPSGNGFRFVYGRGLQYSATYARFDLVLHDGLRISDFESVSFTCQTNADYWGKKMAVIAAPRSAGLPFEFEYDYGTGDIPTEGIVSLAGNNFLPPTTSAPSTLTMQLDPNAAAELDNESELEISIYIHMEHLDGDAEYIITDIVFHPREGVVISVPVAVEEELDVGDDVLGVPSDDSETPVIQADTEPKDDSNPIIIVAVSGVLILAGAAVLIIRKRNRT
ncbi:MAG: hypothetical protein FWD48_05210 [Oscillospiraceae bacterium]|nr:hypothetical protein [Oscillospiraceae bacterium]